MMLRLELLMLGQQPRMFGVEIVAHRFTIHMASTLAPRECCASGQRNTRSGGGRR
jgi:hypothetical protein